MRAERDEKVIDVYLTAEEVYAVQDGQTVGDRPGVTMSDAKIEVLPLSAIELDDSLKDRYANDRLEKGLRAQVKGNLFSNGDLQIIVPAIKLCDVRIDRAHLPRKAIQTPMTQNREELLSRVIPKQGVILWFGGSLQIINLPDHYYSKTEE